jgi:hypothetical protein
MALGAIVAAHSDVFALTPPSDSDGPVKLLGCVVTSQGVLEAEVSSQSDDAMDCNIRCNYELGDKMLSYSFNVTVPARFQGRVGRVDTSVGKAGSYSGEVGSCTKSSR